LFEINIESFSIFSRSEEGGVNITVNTWGVFHEENLGRNLT